jgi:hypothetical protein
MFGVQSTCVCAAASSVLLRRARRVAASRDVMLVRRASRCAAGKPLGMSCYGMRCGVVRFAAGGKREGC